MPVMFTRFVCALLSFRPRDFPENPKLKNLGNLLWKATRFVHQRDKYIVWGIKVITAYE